MRLAKCDMRKAKCYFANSEMPNVKNTICEKQNKSRFAKSETRFANHNFQKAKSGFHLEFGILGGSTTHSSVLRAHEIIHNIVNVHSKIKNFGGKVVKFGALEVRFAKCET